MAVEYALNQFDLLVINTLWNEKSFNPDGKSTALGERVNSPEGVPKRLFSFPMSHLNLLLKQSVHLEEDLQRQLLKDLGMSYLLEHRDRDLWMLADSYFLNEVGFSQGASDWGGETLFIVDRYGKTAEILTSFLEKNYTGSLSYGNAPDWIMDDLLKRCVKTEKNHTANVPLILNPEALRLFFTITKENLPSVYSMYKSGGSLSTSASFSERTISIKVKGTSSTNSRLSIDSMNYLVLKDMEFLNIPNIYPTPSSHKDPSFKVKEMMRIPLDNILGFSDDSNVNVNPVPNSFRRVIYKEIFNRGKVFKNGVVVVKMSNNDLILEKTNNTTHKETLELVQNDLKSYIKDKIGRGSLRYYKAFTDEDAPSQANNIKSGLKSGLDGMKRLLLSAPIKEESLFIETFVPFLMGVAKKYSLSGRVDEQFTIDIEKHTKNIAAALFRENETMDSPFLTEAKDFFKYKSLFPSISSSSREGFFDNQISNTRFFLEFLCKEDLPKMNAEVFNGFLAPYSALSLMDCNNKAFHYLGDESFKHTANFYLHNDSLYMNSLKNDIEVFKVIFHCFERPAIVRDKTFKEGLDIKSEILQKQDLRLLISVATNQNKERINEIQKYTNIPGVFNEPKMEKAYFMKVNLGDIPNFNGLGKWGDKLVSASLVLRRFQESMISVVAHHVDIVATETAHVKLNTPVRVLATAIKAGNKKMDGVFLVNEPVVLELGNEMKKEKFQELERFMPDVADKAWRALSLMSSEQLNDQYDIESSFIYLKDSVVMKGKLEDLPSMNKDSKEIVDVNQKDVESPVLSSSFKI